jgi:hypothetical protein
MPYSNVVTATALLRLISLVNSDVAASTATALQPPSVADYSDGDPWTNSEYRCHRRCSALRCLQLVALSMATALLPLRIVAVAMKTRRRPSRGWL